MIDTKNIEISDYDYELPDSRIAKYPKEKRDESKLLLYHQSNPVSEDVFKNLPKYIPEGTLMVFNNTRVIQARMHFHKDTGAQIEIFLLEPYAPSDYEQMFQTEGTCEWVCLVGNLKKWKDGLLTMNVNIGDDHLEVTAENKGSYGTGYLIEFHWKYVKVSQDGEEEVPYNFTELIDKVGELPIPPYLNRETVESDKQTYQTVYSKIKGSVAAPTAGLHFTKEVLDELDKLHLDREEVTLHVGAGTFKPVKSKTIEEHDMHTEYFCVNKSTVEKIIAHECCALAVGTTSVRTLESLYYLGVKIINEPDIIGSQLHVSQWEPYEKDVTKENITPMDSLCALLDYMNKKGLSALHASTQIIIAPGYEYKIVKMLITNFHQPKSTLLLLVSAFVHGDWRRIYDYALSHEFRFLSYGDSSFIIP